MTDPSADASTRLFGTNEPIPERRLLSAGRLTAEFEAGGLRRVRWDRLEVLRGIAFVVRDSRWGTYRLDPIKLDVVEGPAGFEACYHAACDGPEGRFEFSARILGSADGRLRFEARGSSPDGFATNRTGFVVLHPLEGAAGHAVMVTDPAGAASWTRFPDLVAPEQPMTNIALLRHEPAPGLSLTVRFEGDTFEMEDQRNWTDASFKTYVRPLARGFPYRIERGEQVAQAIEVLIEGGADERPWAPEDCIRLQWSGGAGRLMPLAGLFLDAAGARPSTAVIAKLAALHPRYLQVRTDLRAPGGLAKLGIDMDMAAALGCAIHLDVVIHGVEPHVELAPLASFLSGRNDTVEALFAVPSRDCASRQPRHVPPGEAGPEQILEAARRLFPEFKLIAGTPVGFPEFNRNRPAPGADMIAHATQAIVHAADDRSVMETLDALPHVIRTARSHAGDMPYRLGPCTIGMPVATSASQPVTMRDNRRSPMAMNDPRQRGAFAAAFAFGVAAASDGVTHLTLAAPTGAFGLFHEPQTWPTPGCVDGAPYPVAELFALIAILSGRPRLEVSHDGAGRIAAMATLGPDGSELYIANLTADPVAVLFGEPVPLAAPVACVMPNVGSAPASWSRLQLGPYRIERVL